MLSPGGKNVFKVTIQMLLKKKSVEMHLPDFVIFTVFKEFWFGFFVSNVYISKCSMIKR